jgi:hypothetical protein
MKDTRHSQIIVRRTTGIYTPPAGVLMMPAAAKNTVPKHRT